MTDTPSERVEQARYTVDDPDVIPCPTTGCWLWGGKLNRNGYGQAGGGPMAHREAWKKVNGPVPEGMVLDHVCRMRCCVNPDHLRVVTKRENSIYNSEGPTAKNFAKASCPKCGGAYTPIPWKPDRRMCLPCDTAMQRSRDWKRRGAPSRKSPPIKRPMHQDGVLP
jgi:hypothetical protein